MDLKLFSIGMALAGVSLAATPTPSMAQTTEDEIVVTARKRDETSIAVPVVLTAVGGAELERRAIASLDNLTQLVPQLLIGAGGGNIPGGNMVLRGLSGGDSNSFGDGAVSFNIDGVPISRAFVRRMAQMDIGQIEVLKGSQALFFGKNSPGGIISIRSADPTSTFQAKVSTGYEFNAREIRGEGYISGPLTDSLGVRLAMYGSRMRGWMDNDFADTSIYSPKDKHLPKTREFAIRGTIKWEPSAQFDARAKYTYGKLNDAGVLTSQERSVCVTGVPQLGGGPDDCKLNGRTVRRDIGPVLGMIVPEFGDGTPFLHQNQHLGSLELNYRPTDQLTLTSVTGYYKVALEVADSYLAWDPNLHLTNWHMFSAREFNQELRLRSDFEGPVDFLIGGFYQSARAFVRSRAFIGTIDPRAGGNYRVRQRGEAYSVFGQIIGRPTDTLELTAGGRYSYERKRLTTVESSAGQFRDPPLPVPLDPLAPRKESWTDFSPEFTAAYRPNQRLTLFASYKHGFLSGGFNAGASNFTGDLRYDQETTKGFEGGVKALLLDDTLRTNLSFYSYKVKGLQVTTSTTVAGAATTIQTVDNAGKVSVKGVEFDFNYRAPIAGLVVRGALAYNDGTYDKFTIGCYRGQTQAMGCNAGAPNPVTGVFSTQDRSGTQIARAPKWTGSAGIGYETDLSSNLRLGVNGDVSYSSSYFGEALGNPLGRQEKYAILDANVRIGDRDDSWEVALIGRNLTNKYYGQRITDVPLAGSAAGGTTGTLADQQASVNRGRQIMLRITKRFGSN